MHNPFCPGPHPCAGSSQCEHIIALIMSLIISSGPSPTERLFHTATPLEGDRVLLIGGRTSPIKPCNTISLLQLQRRGVVKGSNVSGSNAKEESKMDDGDESNSVIKTRLVITLKLKTTTTAINFAKKFRF